MKISVQVKANTKQAKVEKVENGYKVFVKEPAVEGKANKAVIKALAEFLKIKPYQLSLLKGEKTKLKVFEIHHVKE